MMKQMMKRLLSVLLISMLCLTGALAEGSGIRIAITACLIEQVTDTEVLVHLLLRKDGSSAYEMQGVDVCLLDASGKELAIADAEYVVFPMTVIPAGSHYLPITLRCTLAEPAQAADYGVRGVTGAQTASPGVAESPDVVPWMGFMRGGVMGVTAWLPLAEGTAAEDYFVSLVGLDSEGYYQGNGELPAGSARHATVEELTAFLRERYGFSQERLTQMGFVFDAQEYALFEQGMLPWLPGVPADFVATGYRRMHTRAASPVVRTLDRIDMQEDGTFVIQGVLKGAADGLWQVAGVESLTLGAADGSEVTVTEFSFDAPFAVVGEGEMLPYRMEGRAPEGFEAVKFRMVYGVAPVEKADMRLVEGGVIIPGVDGEGRVSVSTTIPLQEGVRAEDCFMCVLFLDLENNEYQGAVWTNPGEGWVQDGDVCLPETAAPATCTLDAAMVAMYCVAE